MNKFLNTLRDNRGFSLVEVMISLMIISVAVYGYLEIRQRVAVRERQFTIDLTVMKLMLSLKDQVLADDEFIIPLPDQDDSYWVDTNKSAIRCYDRQGALVSAETYVPALSELSASLTLPEVSDSILASHPKIKLLQSGICSYFLTFYKTGLVVSGVKAPISQYHMRLAYFVGGKADARLKVYTFRPLKTQVFYY